MMARLGDVVTIQASSKQLCGEHFWLLNLDMVEQQTGNVIDYNYVLAENLNGSIVQFDSNVVLYSKLRPNLNKVVLPQMDGYATSEMLPLKPDNKKLSREYLAEYLRSDAFVMWAVSKTAGAKMPRLGTKELLNADIPLPSLEEQKHISQLFTQTNNLLSLRKEQLTKLDELVKSRFVEMFGLPGTDVHGWGMSSLGEICEINPKKSQDARLTNGLLVSFVPMPSVSESGDIDATQVKPYDEVKTGFTYFAENDVLFAKITPCMENGKGAIATGLYNGIGFGSTEFHVLRPAKETATPRWIYTLTVFPQFRIDAASNMTGSAGQRRVPASFLENYRVSVPPLELQNRFAAFVTEVDKSKLSYEMEVAA